jgi:hypothetical protein
LGLLSGTALVDEPLPVEELRRLEPPVALKPPEVPEVPVDEAGCTPDEGAVWPPACAEAVADGVPAVEGLIAQALGCPLEAGVVVLENVGAGCMLRLGT